LDDEMAVMVSIINNSKANVKKVIDFKADVSSNGFVDGLCILLW